MANDPFAEFDDLPGAGPEPAAPELTSASGTDQSGEGTNTVPKERLDEVLSQLAESNARQERLIEAILHYGHAPGAPGGQAPEGQLPEGVDKDVYDVTAPIVAYELQKALAPFQKLLEQKKSDDQLEALERIQPGLSDLLPQIRAEFRKLPEDLRDAFDSPAGAYALAVRSGLVNPSGASGGVSAASLMRNRSQAEGRPGRSPSSSGGPLTPDQIATMNSSDFARLTAYLEARSRSGRSPHEPDSFLD